MYRVVKSFIGNMAKALSIFILLFTIVRCGYPDNRIEQPKVSQGVFDLSGWDFQTNGNLSINGDWELYWNQLIDQRSFLVYAANRFVFSDYCTNTQ